MVLQLRAKIGQRQKVRLPFPDPNPNPNPSFSLNNRHYQCLPLGLFFFIPRAGPRECCLSLIRFSPVLGEKKISPEIVDFLGTTAFVLRIYYFFFFLVVKHLFSYDMMVVGFDRYFLCQSLVNWNVGSTSSGSPVFLKSHKT